ncbi:hypothetical protein CU097_008562 [Rhizopus azygosporus]|uniref:HSF-type DNA-binding domain-containing protein n=1 Tax=Rhizopus azygosporus TaxID=86630 RepID=A0A367JDY5_RHIAZ
MQYERNFNEGESIPVLTNKNSNNTFVHKLYNMVIDNQYQHLIAWSYTGSSFIVCNILEFSRDVLPKHFKHNNFSSFVRQLNMYGFHKVNKSPRGHRTLAENQIWEFSHPKFIKDRPDLLDEIKRKSIETTNVNDKKDNTMMTMIQVSQSELMQRMTKLQQTYHQLKKELEETKYNQSRQLHLLKQIIDFIYQRHGIQISLPLELLSSSDNSNQPSTPSIFITSHDFIDSLAPTTPTPTNTHIDNNHNTQIRHRPVLTVQTHGLSPGLEQQQPTSPALSVYHTALNTPVTPNSAQFISDDDIGF